VCIVNQTDIRDSLSLVVRLDETDDEDPVLLHRVVKPDGKQVCMQPAGQVRSWEYIVPN
jgi:hypothetical protein